MGRRKRCTYGRCEEKRRRGERSTRRQLDTVNNLGLLYAEQDKMAEAEEMYLAALRGYEKACGTEHLSVVRVVNNLCLLFIEQIWKPAFQPEEIVRDKFQVLDKIDNLAYAWGSTSRNVFGMLGRAFLWVPITRGTRQQCLRSLKRRMGHDESSTEYLWVALPITPSAKL